MANLSIPTSIAGISVQGTAGNVLNGPLAALFGGQSLQSLHYPSDLASSATKNHYVQFAIREVVPTGYSSNPTTPQAIEAAATAGSQTTQAAGIGAGSNLSKGLSSITNAIGGTLGELADNSGLPITSGDINAATTYINGAIAGGFKISPPISKTKAYISLYMPDTLDSNYNAEYDQLSLTANPVINSLRMIDQLATPVGQALQGDKSALNGISSDPRVAYLATQTAGLAGLPTTGAVQDLLLKGEGYALNPQLQLIYRGIDLRTFSLSFTFTPKSIDEAQTVKNIIYTFKRNFAPRLQNAAIASNENMFLIAPSIFNVTFQLGANENTYLPRYGDCVLADIAVNHAPNGWAAHQDGAPVQTQLTLTFREIEMVTRDKLDAGQGVTPSQSGTSTPGTTPGSLGTVTITGNGGLR